MSVLKNRNRGGVICKREGGTSADSKTQTDSPSGPVSFHQRRPQSNRPETFFTVQKSNAKSRTMMTNKRTLPPNKLAKPRTQARKERGKKRYKLPVKIQPKKYVTKAASISKRLQ